MSKDNVRAEILVTLSVKSKWHASTSEPVYYEA